MTPCERFGSAPAAFVGAAGSPIDGKPKLMPNGQPLATAVLPIVVEQAFRGVTAGSTVYLYPADMLTGAQSGHRYLVYGHFNFGEATNIVWPSTMTPIERADDDIAFLLNGDALSSITGSVSGSLEQGSRNNSQEPRRPLAGVMVRFTSGNYVVETITDRLGNYQLSGLPEGKTTIEAVLPDPLIARGQVDVRAGGCTRESLLALWNGRIRGRVLRPNRTPMTRTVQLMAVNSRRDDLDRSGRAVTADANGDYEFTEVPPGEYLIGVDIRRAPEDDPSIPPIYFPGTTRVEEARPVRVGRGTVHSGIDFTLPAVLYADIC